MASNPAWQFYGGDWKKDPALARCSLAARAFWLEILDAMIQDASHFIEATVVEFARIARCSETEAAACLDELQRTKTADVTLCHANVTLVLSRRLKREEEKRNQELTRQRRCRKSVKKTACHALVTPMSRVSSSSSSTSSSPPPPKPSARCEPEEPAAEVAAAAEPSRLFPETQALIQSEFPGTPDVVFQAIVEEAAAEEPDVGDQQLADALKATRWPKQYSAKAWIGKIGPFLRRSAMRKPAARAAPACESCGGSQRVPALARGDYASNTAWADAMMALPECEQYRPCVTCSPPGRLELVRSAGGCHAAG